jgi:coproporphyrinogen III oxidase-like Fe-S oxidoreductase
MTEKLNEKDKLNELIGFGLRTKEGIDLSRIPEFYLEQFNQNLDLAQKKWEGCFILNENLVSLTPTGMVYGDAIGVDLMI